MMVSLLAHIYLNPNLYIFIQENAFQNVVHEMATILSRVRWVDIFPQYAIGTFFLECDIGTLNWHISYPMYISSKIECPCK